MKRLFALFLSLAMVLSLAACAGNKTTEPDTEEVQPGTVTEEPAGSAENPAEEPAEEHAEEPEVHVDWTGLNPLTGEAAPEGISDNRPVMVMLNNLKQALPQSGNSQADIIYEILEEGGITRMLAVYQDITSVEGNLGTIRSTRPYYVSLVAGHDGILVHAGGSGAAYDKIEDLNVIDLDALNRLSRGGASLFWRDKGRLNAGVATEHTMYITASDIAEFLANSGWRTQHESSFALDTLFVEDGTPDDGSVANVITVPFSGYKTGEFRYDEESGRYLVSEYGSPYIDQTSGQQVSVKNVIIVMTEVKAIEGDAKGRISVAMTGSGIGYFACGGKYIPINWSRSSETSQYVFTTMDGEQLAFGVGNSYVNIVPTSCAVSFVA